MLRKHFIVKMPAVCPTTDSTTFVSLLLPFTKGQLSPPSHGHCWNAQGDLAAVVPSRVGRRGTAPVCQIARSQVLR